MNVIADFFGLFLTQVTILFQNAFSLVFKFTKIQMVDYLAPIEVVSSFGTIETESGKMVSKNALTIRFQNIFSIFLTGLF